MWDFVGLFLLEVHIFWLLLVEIEPVFENVK